MTMGGRFEPASGQEQAGTAVTDLSYSSNWSGFVDGTSTKRGVLTAVGATFNQVSSDWSVPRLQISLPNGYVGNWDGIGGVFGTEAIVQAGTIEDFQGLRPSYQAFIENYPNPTLVVEAPVAPFDNVQSAIAEESGTWTVTLTDTTEGWTTGPVNIAAAYESLGYSFVSPDTETAEWITEDPSCATALCPFADFSPVVSSEVEDSATGAPASRTPQQFLMINAEGIPQTGIFPANISTATTYAASYRDFAVIRLGLGFVGR
jgi:hypothetical protein